MALMSFMAPLVSVIIPTFNRKEYLKRAISSVRAQSHRPLELIVVVDGKAPLTDDRLTRLEIQTWIGQGVDVFCIENEKSSGGSRARNQGLAQARGEFIAFLDDDDSWESTKVEKQLRAFSKIPSLSVVSCDYRVLKDGAPSHEIKLSGNNGDNIKNSLLMSNVIGSCSLAMVRKKEAQSIGGFDEALPSCQDWEFWLRLANAFGGLYILPEILANYSEHSLPRISNDTWRRVKGYSKMVLKHRQKYPKPILVFHSLRVAQTGIKGLPFFYGASRTLGRGFRYILALLTGYQYKNGEPKNGKAI